MVWKEAARGPDVYGHIREFLETAKPRVSSHRERHGIRSTESSPSSIISKIISLYCDAESEASTVESGPPPGP
eukprot:317649-Hanusia_phi.AAC.1